MSSTIGNNVKISIFGQSHSNGIGVCIDGLPSGKKIDMDKLRNFMQRRAPGNNEYSTKRKEADEFEVISGLVDDTTCGAPFAAIIRNTNTRSGDYNNLIDVPRPAHADYAAQMKFKGAQDVAGGGHFSGRLTAPLCIAGGICKQYLEDKGIQIDAHIKSIYNVSDKETDLCNISEEDINTLRNNEFPVFDKLQGDKMREVISEAAKDLDSVGGVIECIIQGVEAGYGNPMFDGIENRISNIIFGIPAVKGIEFGNGFDCTKLRGSENNDPFYIDNGNVCTKTNNHGGILGGISSGMPIVFRVAMKPTPSIGKEQDSISIVNKTDEKLVVKGRHDPCIVPRAVPCIEAAAAIAIMNILMDN